MGASRTHDRRRERDDEIEFTRINPCDYFSRIGTSVSRWCSSGCGIWMEDEREEEKRRRRRRCCCRRSCFVQLTHEGELCIGPGEAIPFFGRSIFQGDCFRFGDDCFDDGEFDCDGDFGRCFDGRRGCRDGRRGCGRFDDDDFDCDDGRIMPVLCGPRIYRAQFTLNIPADAEIHTDIHLCVDGERIPGSCLTVDHTVGQPSTSITFDVAFDVCEEARVAVISSDELCLPEDRCEGSSATLTITSLDC